MRLVHGIVYQTVINIIFEAEKYYKHCPQKIKTVRLDFEFCRLRRNRFQHGEPWVRIHYLIFTTRSSDLCIRG